MKKCVVIGDDAFVKRVSEALSDYEIVRAPGTDALVADLTVFDGLIAAPLRGVIDSAAIDEPIRTFLVAQGVLTAGDLSRLRLDDLASAEGVTRQSLRRFVRELARSERYPDQDALQAFLVKRGIFI